MSYEVEYQQKLKTADEAVKVVKSGDWVDYAWCVGTPVFVSQRPRCHFGLRRLQYTQRKDAASVLA